MNNTEIKQLNTALKGEYMAIESFDHFIQDTTDANLKKTLQDMQKKHQTHVIQLSDKVQQLGGNPVNSAGAAGVFAEVKMKVSPKKYIDNNLLKSAIEGEKMGVNSYNEILSNVSDPSNKQLVQGMLNENQGIVDELSKQLQKFPQKP